MVRNGSKLLIGLSVAALVALVVYGATQSWGAMGVVSLAGALVAFVLLAVLTVESGEGDIDPASPAAATAAATAQAPGSSLWPLAGAIAAGLVVVGLITHQAIFILGVAALLAVLVEWLMQAWAERASADRGYNVEVRRRLMYPLELPIAAALGLGVVIWSFSRIMLALDKSTGAIVFILAAAIILLFGFLFAARPKLGRTVVAGLCTVGAVGMVAAGIAGASSGERADLVAAYEEGHYTTKKCGPERAKYFDKHALRHVSMKSAAAGRVILENGRLRGEMLGIGEQPAITIARMNPSDILFDNRDPGEFRLAVSLGKAPRTDAEGNVVNGPDGEPLMEDVIDCTQLMGEGNQGMLTITSRRSSTAHGPFKLYIPGVPGAEIELVVP